MLNGTTVEWRPGDSTLEELELAAVMAALRATRGNRREAAALLGVGERTIYRKVTDLEAAGHRVPRKKGQPIIRYEPLSGQEEHHG